MANYLDQTGLQSVLTYLKDHWMGTNGLLGYSTSDANRKYAVEKDSNSGKLFVNVPWAMGEGADGNTLTTAGSSNSAEKLFLVGTKTQNANGETSYSNSNVYATNGSLYASTLYEGTISLANKYQAKGTYATTDTKDTVGSSNNTGKLFLIGASTQSATGVTSYSNSSFYIKDNILFANKLGSTPSPASATTDPDMDYKRVSEIYAGSIDSIMFKSDSAELTNSQVDKVVVGGKYIVNVGGIGVSTEGDASPVPVINAVTYKENGTSLADKYQAKGSYLTSVTSSNHYKTTGFSALSSGMYKITVDAAGHITAATAIQKSDITGLGIPAAATNDSAITEANIKAAFKTALGITIS